MFPSIGLPLLLVASISNNAHAASGQGVVNFTGTVVDAACSLAADSADQTVDFGQISKAVLDADGISEKKNFDIKLTGCELNNTAKIVTLSFVGTTYNGVTQELGTSGNTNTAIVLSDQGGNLVSFDNTAGSATTLQDGDNTLRGNDSNLLIVFYVQIMPDDFVMQL
ncbi:type 1 fimbrial protein, partial [Escherichia coli]|nr:type 1 fimbrial protein [Escherichia coli]